MYHLNLDISKEIKTIPKSSLYHTEKLKKKIKFKLSKCLMWIDILKQSLMKISCYSGGIADIFDRNQ